jgi:hypothetical protein
MKAGGGYASDSSRGDFVRREIKNTAGEITDVYYVHIGQVYQPTAEARSNMTIMQTVMAVAFQATQMQVAKMDGYISELAASNAVLAHLRTVYGTCTMLQANLDTGNEFSACQVPWEAVSELRNVGVLTDTDQFVSGSIVGEIPLYLLAVNIKSTIATTGDNSTAFMPIRVNVLNDGTVLFIACRPDESPTTQGISADGFMDSSPGGFHLIDDDGVHEISAQEFVDEHNKDLLNKASWIDDLDDVSVDPTRFTLTDPAAIIKFLSEEGDESKLRKHKVYDSDTTSDDAHYLYQISVVNGKCTLPDDKDDINYTVKERVFFPEGTSSDTATVDVYLKDREQFTSKSSVEDIIGQEKSCYIRLREMRGLMDAVRVEMENKSTSLQIPQNYLSIATNDMQSIYKLASNVMQDATSQLNQIVRNTR